MTSCNGFAESELELRWYPAEDGRHWLPILAENMILPPCCEFQCVLRVVNNRLKSEHGQNTAAAVARWLPDTPIVGEDGQEGQSDGSWFVTMARVLFAGKEGRTPSRALSRATCNVWSDALPQLHMHPVGQSARHTRRAPRSPACTVELVKYSHSHTESFSPPVTKVTGGADVGAVRNDAILV